MSLNKLPSRRMKYGEWHAPEKYANDGRVIHVKLSVTDRHLTTDNSDWPSRLPGGPTFTIQAPHVGPVSAVGKRVGPLIERFETQIGHSPITINWFAGVCIICDQPPLICFGVCGRKAITKT
jgi:hypothetical protein